MTPRALSAPPPATFVSLTESPRTHAARPPRRGRRTAPRSAAALLASAIIVTATAIGAAAAAAQTTGAIEGTVADVQGLAVPGATVTLSGEELIAPLVTYTLVDGSYRFRALGRGSYDVTFELSGFRTLVREGVIIEGSRVIRIDAALEVATVEETVTVTGDAPVVDIRTTALVNDFGVEEL